MNGPNISKMTMTRKARQFANKHCGKKFLRRFSKEKKNARRQERRTSKGIRITEWWF